MKELIERKKVWILDSWWKKGIYCVGWFYLTIFILSFLVGFIHGVISTL
jgi:hypothetical protein